MMNGSDQVVMKIQRSGNFGRYRLIGLQYEFDSGKTGWSIQTYPADGGCHDYWVSEGEFYELNLHLWPEMSNTSIMYRGNIIQDLSNEEKTTVLQAILEWGNAVLVDDPISS